MTIERRIIFQRFLIVTVPLTLLFLSPSARCHSSARVVQKNDSARLLLLSKHYLSHGRAGAAQNLLETMLQLEPNDVEAHFYLGQSYAKQTNYTKARREFRLIIQGDHPSEIAKSANEQLLRLPRRFLAPKRPNSLTNFSLNDQTKKNLLVIFLAPWDKNSERLNEIAESAAARSPTCQIKIINIASPEAKTFYDLLNVSALPTVILLSKSGCRIITFMVGKIDSAALLHLVHADQLR